MYTNDELLRVDSQPNASMGDADTFADFLNFCNREYPAEHQVVVLWDHGGGSLLGAESDELYKGDLMGLPEMRAAFNAMPAASGMYELVGFDACLMATVDVADMLDERARYLVASEEVEPGMGWDYTGMMQELAADHVVPLNGEGLGRAICDSYFAACQSYSQHKDVTLSVVDLTRFSTLLEAYNAVGDEALLKAYEGKQDFYSAFERAAYASESYGAITDKVSDYDMVDLGDLMRNTGELLDGDEAVLEALDGCVAYQVAGELRPKASGLSCYFIYTGDQNGLDVFAQVGTSQGFRYLYEYPLNGSLSQGGLDYVNALSAAPTQEQELFSTDLSRLDDFPLREGSASDINDVQWVLEVGPELGAYVSDVTTQNHYAVWDEANDRIQSSVILGYDTNFAGDYERGWFQDGFSGYWYNLDGQLITVWSDIGHVDTQTGIVYETLRVPVLLNGEYYVLEVHRTSDVSEALADAWVSNDSVQLEPEDRKNERYEIYGARKPGDEETRIPGKELLQLEPGDKIEPLFWVYTYDYSTPEAGDGKLETRAYTSLTYSEDLEFSYEFLGEGYYYTSFNVTDIAGVKHESDVGWYVVEGNMVYSGSW